MVFDREDSAWYPKRGYFSRGSWGNLDEVFDSLLECLKGTVAKRIEYSLSIIADSQYLG